MTEVHRKTAIQELTPAGDRKGLSGSLGGKFLTFFLGKEEYGIEILRVHEIIGMLPITRVPGIPSHISGIINLRGQIIPVVDLRRKFGMETIAPALETCIIVVTVHEVDVGIIVDRVSEVFSIAPEDIDSSPSFGRDVNSDFILGIGKSDSKVKILLNIDRLVSNDRAIHSEKDSRIEPAIDAPAILAD